MITNDNPKVQTRVTSISFEDDAPLPLYKKWWFWLLLIIGAVVVTAILYLVTNFGFFSSVAVPISPLAS